MSTKGEHEASSDPEMEAQNEIDDLFLLLDALPVKRSPLGLRERLLASCAAANRFARFAQSVGQLLDLSEDEAAQMLARVDAGTCLEPGFLPGMLLCHVTGGPRVKDAITGFVRLEAGAVFPDHEHEGEESVLVLQGSYEDDGTIVRPGDVVTLPAGSRHSFRVRPGPDLLYLAVVHTGLRVGDMVLRATDPRA